MFDAQSPDDAEGREAGAGMRVALECASCRADRGGRVADREALVEMIADPALKLCREAVDGGKVAGRGLDTNGGTLVDQQEARDGVGELRAGLGDEAHGQIDVGEGGARGGDRPAVDDQPDRYSRLLSLQLGLVSSAERI